MEVSCSSYLIVYVVICKKGACGGRFLRASGNSRDALFAVSSVDRVGNFVLVGKNSTMSPMCLDADLVAYIVQ